MITADEMKQVGDVAATATTGLALVELLPAISAALTSIWFVLRIYQELKNIRNNDNGN